LIPRVARTRFGHHGRSRLSGWLAALTFWMPCAQAADAAFQWGEFNSYRDVTVSYGGEPFWMQDVAGRRLDVRLEASVGQAQAPAGTSGKREIWHVGMAPAVRYWITPQTGLEYLIGANLFSGVRLGDKNISTAFQFGNSAGLFHRLSESRWTLGLRITHYSNADVKRPNPGQNYIQLRASHAFN
jgi:lipid A 3-O-deacylase